jgi:hypothetical protein
MSRTVTVVETSISFVPKDEFGCSKEYVPIMKKQQHIADCSVKYATAKLLQRVNGEIGIDGSLVEEGTLLVSLHGFHASIHYHMVSKETGREYYVHHFLLEENLSNGYMVATFATISPDVFEEVWGAEIELAVKATA